MAAKKPGSLFKAAEPAPEPVAEQEKKEGPNRGKHLISGLYDPAAYRQFGVLAAELGVDKRELLREALNDLFRKHGKAPIA